MLVPLVSFAAEHPNGSVSCTVEAEQPGNRDDDFWERKYVLLGLEGYYVDVEADPRVLSSAETVPAGVNLCREKWQAAPDGANRQFML